MTLILASSSPYRRRLLQRLQLPFDSVAPDLAETPLPGEDGATLAARLAREKAAAVQALHPDAVVIGSDQVPCLDADLLDKPGNADRAHHQLSLCSGRQVVFHTGLCVMAPGQAPLCEVVPFSVHFRALDDSEIEQYLLRDEPYDCAGSFKWESLGIALFERLEGSDPTALEGLPLIALCSMLRKRGFNPLGARQGL